MDKVIKGILFVAGGVGLIFGISKLISLKQASDQLVIRVVGVRDIDIVGGIQGYLRFKVDVLFINSSDIRFDIHLQSIKVLYNAIEIGYTLPINKTLALKPATQSMLKDITFNIPVIDIPVRNIAQAILNVDFKPIVNQLELAIYTNVNGVPLTIPYSFADTEEAAGVGITAANKRTLKDGSKYDYLFPGISNGDPVISKDGSIEDTVKYMGFIVKKYHTDTAKLASLLKGKDLYDTCKKIFDFCYNHIQYELDKKSVEQLRRPARTWRDRRQGVDCDDFSIFVASLLYNLNIPFQFRITKYNGKPNYQHIYIIIPAP